MNFPFLLCIYLNFLNLLSHGQVTIRVSQLDRLTHDKFTNKVTYLNLNVITSSCPFCFVAITNAFDVKISAVNSPIVLIRHVKVQVESITNRQELLKELLHVPVEYYRKLGSPAQNYSATNPLPDCTVKHLTLEHGLYHPKIYCTKINFTSYLLSSRPWKHELYIGIIPERACLYSNFKYLGATSTPLQKIGIQMWHNRHVSRYTIPGMKLSILLFENILLCRQLHRLYEILISENSSPIETSIYFVANWNNILQYSHYYVYSPCSKTYFQPIDFQLEDKDTLQTKNLMNWLDFLLWRTSNVSSNKWWFDTEAMTLEDWNAKALDTRSRIANLPTKLLTRTRTFELLVNVFGTEFKYLQHFQGKSDIQHCILTVVKAKMPNMTRPLVLFAYPAGQIQFISCGDTIKETMSLFELLPEFDLITWLLFSVITCLIPIWVGIRSSCKSSALGDFFNFLIKLITEQSSPFKDQHTSQLSQKLFAAWLLVGIFLIWNEFKNGKVSSAIAPTPFVPFERFKHLTSSNYSIFTELDMYEYGFDGRIFEGSIENSICKQLTKPHTLYCRLHLTPWIARLVPLLSVVKRNAQGSGEKTLSQVVNNSYLIKDMAERVSEILRLNSDSRMVEEKARAIQKKLSISKLRKCSSNAIVAYEPQVNEYEAALRKEGYLKVSVGKEIIVKSELGFWINGMLPKYLLKRLRGIQTSGIIEWWNIFCAKYLTAIRKTSNDDTNIVKLNTKTSTAYVSMLRNMISTLLVWLIGCTLSLCCWITENLVHRKLYVWLVLKSMKHAVNLCLKIGCKTIKSIKFTCKRFVKFN